MALTLDGTTGISATGDIISSAGIISATGNISCNNLSPSGDLTILAAKQILTSATIGRTVKLNSGTGGNAIQFGFQNDGGGVFLLVTIDGTNEYKVALTAVP